MPDDLTTQPSFPRYSPPTQGLTVAQPEQAKMLMRTIKSVAKLARRKPTLSRRKGLTTKDTVSIKRRKKVKFY